MLLRALEVTHAHLAPEIAGSREPFSARRVFRALADKFLLILRRLGEFFAAGGPMS